MGPLLQYTMENIRELHRQQQAQVMMAEMMQLLVLLQAAQMLFGEDSLGELFRPKEITGQQPGGWLAPHGGYSHTQNGYQITQGAYAGHTAVHAGNGQFQMYNAQGLFVGVWVSPSKTEKIASPLTFDLNGNGKVGTTGIAGGRRFDIDGDGKVDKTAWAEKGDGVLAFDADGDGRVGTNGKELFGNNSDVDGDGRADGHANGFEALKALAVRHLGKASVADGKLGAEELRLLEKKAGLSMLVDGERKRLSDVGITEINLGYQQAGPNRDAQGNEHRQVGAGYVQNGETRKVDDVWFKYRS